MRLVDRATTRCNGTLARALALILCLCLTTVPRLAMADEPDISSNPEYQAALGEIDRIANAYSALAQEQASTFSQLETVRGQIADNEAQVVGVEEQINTSKAELAEMKKSLAGHVSSDYKSGGVSLLSIVLSSDSFEDAISRMYYHGVVVARQASEIDRVNAKKQELQTQQDQLKDLKADLQKQADDLEGLAAQQAEQAEAMQVQQMEASAYLNSLSAELKAELAKQDEELLGSAQAVADEAAAEEQSQDAAAGEGEAASSEDAAGDASASAGDDAKDAGAAGTASGEKAGGASGASTTQGGSNGGGNAGAGSSGSSSSNSSSGSSSSGSNSTSKPTTTTPTTPAPKPTTPTAPATPKTNGSGSQQAVLNACYSTGGGEALNNGWGCAGWVYCVFRDSGVYNRKPRCAAWYYENWCFSSNRADLQPGMVIAVSTWTGTSAGKIYGHVGIYVGNNTVRHLSAGAVREMSLDKWIKQYGTTVTPMWGWNGGIALS